MLLVAVRHLAPVFQCLYHPVVTVKSNKLQHSDYSFHLGNNTIILCKQYCGIFSGIQNSGKICPTLLCA